MLKATKKQIKHILELLENESVFSRLVLNFDENLEFKECKDRIYIDDEITFDQMAKIVDYLRANAKNNIKNGKK